MRIPATLLLLTAGKCALTQCPGDSVKDRGWSFHAQATAIWQYHPDFSANYTGKNSLQTSEPAHVSFTSTLFAGRKLWKQAALYVNPEAAGGSGLSAATGIAGFPNGETFRIGSKQLKLYVARLFLEQKIAIGKETTWDPDDVNQVQQHTPATYLSIRAGKFSIADFFDNNSYSHDPRGQFLNWSLMSYGAWDYPANTRGYTIGMVVEYHSPAGAVRAAITQMPSYANGPTLNNQIGKAHGLTVEGEKNIRLNDLPGTVRLLLFHNLAQMGNYEEAIKNTLPADIVAVRGNPRSKNGFGASLEQEVTSQSAIFIRGSWNDGSNETWAFTEIDRSLSGGLVWNGSGWSRKLDELGAALVVNGISAPHRNYLKAGGYGFIIGDGKLNYGQEAIIETYYKFSIPLVYLSLSPDYQFVLHPAYNKDRGPVHIISVRAHVQL